MNRILLVGVAGVVIICAALGLNFWLNRDASQDVAVSDGDKTPRVVAEQPGATEEPAPSSSAGTTSGTTQSIAENSGTATESLATEERSATASGSETTDPAASSATSETSPATAEQPPKPKKTIKTTEATQAPKSGSADDFAESELAAAAPAPAQRGETVKATAPEPTQTAETAATEDPVASAAVAAAPAGDEDAPSFDVVRLSRKGDSVFAGRGKPGATVDILSDDESIGSVEVDDRGEWVFVPTAPLEPGSHELSLKSKDEGDGSEVTSDHVVVLVVPKTGENIAGEPEEKEESEPLALLVPSDGKTGETKVLQKPTTVPGSVEAETGDLALDIVDYDNEGSVALSGRGKPKASVRVYLDNEFVGEAPVDEDGVWRAAPDEGVNPGVYDLRVDQVVEEKVVSRLELPFSRAEPITSLRDEQLIIVQPGNSLWRIARRTLGEGIAYSVIYEANKGQIRDPDLIYPGQIFQVPKRAVN